MVMRGDTITLTGKFFQYPGGPPVDPTGLSLLIQRDGITVAGPIAVGAMQKITTGVYEYEYAVPVDAQIGGYYAIWTGTLPGDLNPSTGYETFEVEAFSTVPGYSGCPWPIDPDCAGDAWATTDPQVQQRAAALATATLRRLTLYRVGGCPVKVRPRVSRNCCFIPVSDGIWYQGAAFHPGVDEHGVWRNGCGGRGLVHGSVSLPMPVGEVYEVKVSGVVLTPEQYRVEGNLLIWQGGGEAPWPLDQDLSKSDDLPGTFSVTMLNTMPVDATASCAASILAAEFAKAATDGKCRLPSGVTAIVRQGVSMEITPGMFPDGFTGIREVDAFIGLWNPKGAAQAPRATVWSPGVQRPYVTGV